MDNNKNSQERIQQLVILSKQGDRNAMEEILFSFKGYIYKISSNIYLKNYDLEDLIQIGNMSLIKAINSYKPEKGEIFLAYAVRAIKNNFNYLIRQNSRYGYESSINKRNEEGLELADIITSEENIEEDFITKSLYERIYESMKLLSDEERELVEAVFYNNISLAEFARKKNLEYWVCKRRKTVALNKIKRNMRKYFFS